MLHTPLRSIVGQNPYTSQTSGPLWEARRQGESRPECPTILQRSTWLRHSIPLFDVIGGFDGLTLHRPHTHPRTSSAQHVLDQSRDLNLNAEVHLPIHELIFPANYRPPHRKALVLHFFPLLAATAKDTSRWAVVLPVITVNIPSLATFEVFQGY